MAGAGECCASRFSLNCSSAGASERSCTPHVGLLTGEIGLAALSALMRSSSADSFSAERTTFFVAAFLAAIDSANRLDTFFTSAWRSTSSFCAMGRERGFLSCTCFGEGARDRGAGDLEHGAPRVPIVHPMRVAPRRKI